MIITTPRLLLRPSTLEDASFAMALVNSPKWLKMIGDRKVYDLEAAEKYLQKAIDAFDDTKGIGQWLIMNKETNEKIGFTGLYNRKGLDHLDIGFALVEKHEGNGFAYEATNAIMDEVIKSTGIKRIEAITLEENKPSRTLLEKLGLRFEKIINLPDDPVDLMLYAIDL